MSITTKPTFQSLADHALLTQAEIVRRSGLSIPTVQKIMRGESVRRSILLRALAVINDELETTYDPEDIDAHYS